MPYLVENRRTSRCATFGSLRTVSRLRAGEETPKLEVPGTTLNPKRLSRVILATMGRQSEHELSHHHHTHRKSSIVPRIATPSGAGSKIGGGVKSSGGARAAGVN